MKQERIKKIQDAGVTGILPLISGNIGILPVTSR
jgi:hypothetical protein